MSNHHSMQQFAPAERALSRGLSSNSFHLAIRQEPLQARVAVGKEKDRKPVDPPPVIQLSIDNNVEDYRTLLQSPYFFMSCSLLPARSDKSNDDNEEPINSALTGTLVSSLHRLKDTDNKDGGFFVFGDLSVKREGKFRLKFSLYEIGDSEVVHLKSTISDEFTVYSAKTFPGMAESTFLTRSFSDQGVRLRVRKEPRTLLRKRGPASDNYEPRHYNTQVRRQSQAESPISQMPPRHGSYLASETENVNRSAPPQSRLPQAVIGQSYAGIPQEREGAHLAHYGIGQQYGTTHNAESTVESKRLKTEDTSPYALPQQQSSFTPYGQQAPQNTLYSAQYQSPTPTNPTYYGRGGQTAGTSPLESSSASQSQSPAHYSISTTHGRYTTAPAGFGQLGAQPQPPRGPTVPSMYPNVNNPYRTSSLPLPTPNVAPSYGGNYPPGDFGGIQYGAPVGGHSPAEGMSTHPTASNLPMSTTAPSYDSRGYAQQ